MKMREASKRTVHTDFMADGEDKNELAGRPNREDSEDENDGIHKKPLQAETPNDGW